LAPNRKKLERKEQGTREREREQGNENKNKGILEFRIIFNSLPVNGQVEEQGTKDFGVLNSEFRIPNLEFRISPSVPSSLVALSLVAISVLLPAATWCIPIGCGEKHFLQY
jgi:hypothetical protein